MKTRLHTLDQYIVKEMNTYKPLLDLVEPEDVVLDIGAHIGAFADRVRKKHGICHSYEPEPNNYILLEENIGSSVFNKIYNQAVVGSDQKSVGLYLSKTNNTGSHSTTKYRGRGMVEVPAINVKDLKKHKPKYVKVDCEGAEYEIMDEIINWDIQALAIEIHCFKKEWRNEKAPELLNKLRAVFPNHYKEGKITPKCWYTMFIGSK
tara:strand:+ start:959 stop:1576 length:618 start_codon:yes stop_codon:yes gene_type:complete